MVLIEDELQPYPGVGAGGEAGELRDGGLLLPQQAVHHPAHLLLTAADPRVGGRPGLGEGCGRGGRAGSDEFASADPPHQLPHPGDGLGTDGAGGVDGAGLDLGQVSSNVVILHLHPFSLPFPTEGQKLAAEGDRTGDIRIVFTVVQHLLQLLLIPARKVITVEILQNILFHAIKLPVTHIRPVGENVRPSFVVLHADVKVDLRNLRDRS